MIINKLKEAALTSASRYTTSTYSIKKFKFADTKTIIEELGYDVIKQHCTYHCDDHDNPECYSGICTCGCESKHTHDKHCNGWFISVNFSSAM